MDQTDALDILDSALEQVAAEIPTKPLNNYAADVLANAMTHLVVAGIQRPLSSVLILEIAREDSYV